MIDYELARKLMVDNQLRTHHVTDRRILAVMGQVPREQFVPDARRPIAYIDAAQGLGAEGSSRFMLPPALFAKLVQLAEIEVGDSVLDIGSGTGYSLAVLAGLGARVLGLEPDAALVETAKANLVALGITNASVARGSSSDASGSFDVIILEGAVETVPANLFARLNDGGRLVAVIRRGAVAVANVYVKSGAGVAARPEFNASLPSLSSAQPAAEFVF